MQQNQVIIFLFMFAFVLYFLSCIKKRPATLFLFLGRSIAGLSYLYLFNSFCIARDISTCLGINLITLSLSAFLGIPGILLAYGANLLRFF